MIYPTVDKLTKGKFNRYQLAIATAKCARMITDEYVAQRARAESMLTGSKDGGSIMSMVDPELADNKAVKNAIRGIADGEYEIVDGDEEVPEEEKIEEED